MLLTFSYKRILYSILLLCIWSGLRAQSLWSKTYVEDRPIMLFSSVNADNNLYYILGMAADKNPPYLGRAMAAVVDSNGVMTKYQTRIDAYNGTFGVFLNTLIETTSGDYAFTGLVLDTVPLVLFGRFDKSLDSMLLYTYTDVDPYAYTGYALLQTSPDVFYVAGVYSENSSFNTNVVLLKIDSNGNRLWQKEYDQFKSDNIRSLVALKNGNLLLGAQRNNLNQTIEHANTWLLEVDTGGNIVDEWFDPNDSTYMACGLLQTKEGGFIYGAQKKYKQTVNSVYKTATVVKMDSAFTKKWTFQDGSYSDETAIVDIIELNDGSFVACGNKPFYGTDSSMLSGWIVKLDSQGTVIWNRTYAGLQTSFSYNYLSDIDILPDGSLIAVGQCKNTNQQPSQVGWFLKLDSNGCEIENCLVGVIDNFKEDFQVSIYPNPFTTRVSLLAEGLEFKRISITIYNSIGTKVYNQDEINPTSHYSRTLDLGYLPNGLYFLEVMIEGKRIIKRLVKEG